MHVYLTDLLTVLFYMFSFHIYFYYKIRDYVILKNNGMLQTQVNIKKLLCLGFILINLALDLEVPF